MAVTITYLIMNIVRTYAIYLFIDRSLKQRCSFSGILWLAYGVYYVVVSIFHLTPSLSNAFHNIIINLTFAFLIGCLFYRASYRSRLICAAFIYILSIASEDCTIVILTLMFKTSLSLMLNNTHLVIMGYIISMSLLLAIVKMVNPLFKRQATESNNLYWFAVFAIPAGCIYILHSLVSQLEQSKSDDLFVLITILLLFAFNILVFFLYNNLLQEEATKYENKLLIRQNADYENQALLIQDFQNELRGQRHDLQNHISMVRELAELQKTDELLTFLNHWSNDIADTEPGVHTDNILVNAMINSKLYMAQLQDTTLYANINIPPELSITHTDLTVILGNLFDNALEACSKLPPDDRTIRSDICHMHNTLTITISNTCDISNLNMHNGTLYTTKQDSDSHGIGLNRVRQIVEKYDGLFDYCFSKVKDNDVFIVHVLLYVNFDTQKSRRH